MGAVALTLVSCGVPPWPVPVPQELERDRTQARVGVSLPLCGGAPTCAERDALRGFLAEQASRCRKTPGAKRVPASADELVTAFAKARLSTNDFPRSATALPAAFRQEKSYAAIDGSNPDHEDSSAVLYRGFWWTFWDRQPLTELPIAKASGYSYLIVFPEFEGRDGCANMK